MFIIKAGFSFVTREGFKVFIGLKSITAPFPDFPGVLKAFKFCASLPLVFMGEAGISPVCKGVGFIIVDAIYGVVADQFKWPLIIKAVPVIIFILSPVFRMADIVFV